MNERRKSIRDLVAASLSSADATARMARASLSHLTATEVESGWEKLQRDVLDFGTSEDEIRVQDMQTEDYE